MNLEAALLRSILLSLIWLWTSNGAHIKDVDNDLRNCWKNYPYTYSKCLRLCSAESEPTCLDDELCVCNFNFLRFKAGQENHEFQTLDSEQNLLGTGVDDIPYINRYFGVSQNASCHFSDFCEELCSNDDKLLSLLEASKSSNIIKGVLCKSSRFELSEDFETEPCICSM